MAIAVWHFLAIRRWGDDIAPAKFAPEVRDCRCLKAAKEEPAQRFMSDVQLEQARKRLPGKPFAPRVTTVVTLPLQAFRSSLAGATQKIEPTATWQVASSLCKMHKTALLASHVEALFENFFAVKFA
ncbi:hypothetical protein [Gemmata obscuriglobus]|uniref:hypothetical protein n=1 Tax=Gemmata obscuriglobus TaxID=114 RepID=UPI0011CEB2FD|nr:hypothetical protein [Gemmata obscuriglobus]